VKLSFSKEALRAIAREAMRRNSGARGLRAIMEDAMLEIMYDVPYREGVKECKISETVVTKHEAPQLVFEKEKKSA
jgi:ATP-dependent Clp protease ATP-binding subunit ClpX